MLFNAPEFLFAFLPVTLLGFFLIGRYRPGWAIAWLVLASLFFYGWWRVEYIPLLLGSVSFNFAVGLALARRPRRWLLALGVGANLAALGWYKYSGFLAAQINSLADAGLPVPQVILPLAISFYTFQQIAYLVDANAGATRETGFARYMLFVMFFPQLIAGPIVHHREMLKQFDLPETYRPRIENLILGLTGFAIGLFKKVFIADPLRPLSDLAFGPAADGIAPPFIDAWMGSVAYALQLYFDFSGYSDMAVGLGLMFGIRLPLNFLSPYKAANIIEFWARWHMTLTRFLTAYMYNPIVMAITRRRARAGKPMFSRSAPRFGPFIALLAIPTLLTMTVAGVWHGAGWQFLIFGLLHGAYLVINHGWLSLRRASNIRRSFGWPGRAAGVLVTFLAVTVSLVFFKAATLPQALNVVQGMAGYGDSLHFVPRLGGLDPSQLGIFGMLLWRVLSPHGVLLLCALTIVWLMPNTAEYVARIAEPVRRGAAEAGQAVRWSLAALRQRMAPQWNASFVQGGAVGILFGLALLRALSVAPTEFLYYTF